MGLYVGVSWSNKGWVAAVSRDEERWECTHHPALWSMWNTYEHADRILLGAPIGLPSVADGRRTCDEAAKRLLGPRQHSVFYTPVRPAVYEDSLEAAKEINEQAGYSIQNQTWSHVPQLREIDEFLADRPAARDVLRETHSEVCFHALNGGPLTAPRTSQEGHQERRGILREVAPDLVSSLEEAINRLTRPRYAPLVTEEANLHAAYVAAVAARRANEHATLPEHPPRDENGLPMEIVYPADAWQITLEMISS